VLHDGEDGFQKPKSAEEEIEPIYYESTGQHSKKERKKERKKGTES
jgi:hypothetical protein